MLFSYRGYLTLACKLWGEKGKIKQALMMSLLSHVDSENDAVSLSATV